MEHHPVSSARVAKQTYTVPSRLIGKEVQIHLYADWVEVYYKGHLVEGMARVRGEGKLTSITVTSSAPWCTSPEPSPATASGSSCFPTMHFRLAYDAHREWRGERADVEYVRILHLRRPLLWKPRHGSHGMEATVDSALLLLLEAGESFDYAEVRDLAEPKVPEAPLLTLSSQPDLKTYDPCSRVLWPMLRIAATGASTGCAGSPGCPLARPGRPSSTTACPWRCASNWIIWPMAASSSAASTCWLSGCPAPARPTPCAPWATAWWKLATPSSSLRPTAWCRTCWPPNATWTCPAGGASWTASTPIPR